MVRRNNKDVAISLLLLATLSLLFLLCLGRYDTSNRQPRNEQSPQQIEETAQERSFEDYRDKVYLQRTKFINMRTGEVYVGKQYTKNGLIAVYNDGNGGEKHVSLRKAGENTYVQF